MAPKLCANLNFLFAENNTNILDRFRLAKKAGFTTVESVIPNDTKLEEIVAVQKETGLKVVLLNIITGIINYIELVVSYKCVLMYIQIFSSFTFNIQEHFPAVKWVALHFLIV